MKLFFYLIFSLFTLFSFAQTWQSAYDSCLKYQEKQQYKKAIEWGDKALELYEKQNLIKDTMYSKLLAQQSNLYETIGQYQKSIFYLKKDSVFCIPHRLKYADVCASIGSLYLKMNQYFSAEKVLIKVKEIYLKELGKEYEGYIHVCNSLGLIYSAQDKYKEANDLFNEVLEIYPKLKEYNDKKYYILQGNLAYVRVLEGKYSEAEIIYLNATKALEKYVFEKKEISYLGIFNNLGSVYISLAKYAQAETIYKKIKNLFRETVGVLHSNYSIVCNNLATVYFYTKRYSQAEKEYQEAKEIILKSYGRKHKNYALTCSNLSKIYLIEGKYELAEKEIKEAMDVYSELVGKETADFAYCSAILGEIYFKQSNYSQAESLLIQAKNTLSKIYDNPHKNYIQTCFILARMYQSQNKIELASKYFSEYIKVKLTEIQMNFKNLSENEKENYIKHSLEKYTNSFYYFVSQAHKQIPDITVLCYDFAIQNKGIILESVQKVKSRILNSQDETVKQLYVEWKKMKNEYSNVVNLTSRARKEKHIDLDSLIQRVNDLEKQLALKSEDFAKTFVPKSVTWKDIQNALKKDEAAVEIIQINLNEVDNKDSILYMALVVKKNAIYPELVLLPNGNTLEKNYKTYYRRSIRTKLQDKESYNAFWYPLAKSLKGIKTVYFSPDGVYNYINPATLQNPKTKKFLCDEIQIINVTNTKDILNKRTYTAKNNYLIGDPKFDLQITIRQDNEKPIQERVFDDINQLKGAEKEVKQIATLLPNAKVIIGVDATEEYVKSLKNPRILHIATHGYFKKEQYQSSTQAMLNAGLLFAGVIDYDRMEIRPLDKEDGKLTAFEVMNMELDSTELVVLSACETGLGQASKEGVYGLQRAFKVAGAQSIIMSLWKVSDEATQLLMTKFYENWQKKGMDKRKAFETAQKEIRKQYKEPYYWGAFVMIE